MKNIAVLMGGYSKEAEISFKSAEVVLKHLDKNKYNLYPIAIYENRWVYISPSKEEIPINKGDFSIIVDDTKITFDVVFNAIHGSPGEDGYLQAYFKMIGIPITGSGMYASALTFNKRDTLSVLKAFGINSAKSLFVNKGYKIDSELIIREIGLPCFVKANRSGSSFGVYKVYEADKLEETIEKALTFDEGVLIESYLKGTEVSVGVITYKGKVKVLPITEIISENDFFNYEAKYLGKSQEITPANIPEEVDQKIRVLAQRIYQVLGLKGFSRSEFIIVENQPYLLEVNTNPGLTEQSILPQQAQKEGISLSELFEQAIEEVLS